MSPIHYPDEVHTSSLNWRPCVLCGLESSIQKSIGIVLMHNTCDRSPYYMARCDHDDSGINAHLQVLKDKKQ